LPRVTITDLAAIIIRSFLGIVFYFIFENNALVYTIASNASMLVAAMPMFTLSPPNIGEHHQEYAIPLQMHSRQRISWVSRPILIEKIIGVF
jgi:hypothetical protein